MVKGVNRDKVWIFVLEIKLWCCIDCIKEKYVMWNM